MNRPETHSNPSQPGKQRLAERIVNTEKPLTSFKNILIAVIFFGMVVFAPWRYFFPAQHFEVECRIDGFRYPGRLEDALCEHVGELYDQKTSAEQAYFAAKRGEEPTDAPIDMLHLYDVRKHAVSRVSDTIDAFHAERYLVFSIANVAEKKLIDVALRIRGGKGIAEVECPSGLQALDFEQSIPIGDLAAKDTVTVRVWEQSPLPYTEVGVSHETGYQPVTIPVPVPGSVDFLYRMRISIALAALVLVYTVWMLWMVWNWTRTAEKASDD